MYITLVRNSHTRLLGETLEEAAAAEEGLLMYRGGGGGGGGGGKALFLIKIEADEATAPKAQGQFGERCSP